MADSEDCNQHGLRRTIPPDIKRLVRVNAGFGCVICGSSIVDYEHVDPTFANAREHNPDCITLLCIQHHGKVTRGFLSKESVKVAMRDPCCKRQGYSNEFFDIGRTFPRVTVAN